MDRKELVSKIRTSRIQLESAIGRFPEPRLEEPALQGGWSVKDLMAHLGWWELRAADIYGALSRGSIPRMVIAADEVDKMNARVIEEYRKYPLVEVRAFEAQAFHHLMTIVETAPEADLFSPHRFSWTTGQPFANWIVWNTYEHYEEHIPLLEKRLVELENEPDLPGMIGGTQAIRRATDFLKNAGRDIDKALLDYCFRSATSTNVMEVLSRYQNPDGGFFGLEVDIKAPQSNPFATELALSAMRWANTPADHPVLLKTLGYLETTQLDDGTWRFTSEIYQHNLATWFQGEQGPNLNPSCTIAGILKQLGVGSERLHRRVQGLFDRLAKPEDLLGSEYYQVRPYAYYFLTGQTFPQADFYRWGVVWWLVRAHLTNPELDATHWMDFAPMPSSSIAKYLPETLLRAKLDQLLAEQAEDGGWPTPYDPVWRGWNTATNMLVLRAHGRI